MITLGILPCLKLSWQFVRYTQLKLTQPHKSPSINAPFVKVSNIYFREVIIQHATLIQHGEDKIIETPLSITRYSSTTPQTAASKIIVQLTNQKLNIVTWMTAFVSAWVKKIYLYINVIMWLEDLDVTFCHKEGQRYPHITKLHKNVFLIKFLSTHFLYSCSSYHFDHCC